MHRHFPLAEAQLPLEGVAVLLQEGGCLLQQRTKDLPGRGGGLHLHGPLLGGQGVLQQVFRQLLDLLGFPVDFVQVAPELLLPLVLAIAQDFRVDEQGGQGGAQVVGHLGDKGLVGGVGAGFPLLLGAEGQAHGVQTLRQGGEVVVPPHGDGPV